MNKIITLILIVFSISVLHAGEGTVFNIKNDHFTQSVLTDSVQKKDVWAKNYHEKSPLAAGLMSGLFPGIGQMYNGQLLKGGLFIGGELFLLTSIIKKTLRKKNSVSGSTDFGAVGFLAGVWLGVRIWGVVDAVSSAQDINEKLNSEGNKPVTLIYFPKDGVQNIGLVLHF